MAWEELGKSVVKIDPTQNDIKVSGSIQAIGSWTAGTITAGGNIAKAVTLQHANRVKGSFALGEAATAGNLKIGTRSSAATAIVEHTATATSLSKQFNFNFELPYNATVLYLINGESTDRTLSSSEIIAIP